MDVEKYLAGVPSHMVQPHVILPAQHFNPPRKLAPEHRLMMAVLDDAVRCVERYRWATDARGRRLFREAQEWLLAEELHWPYSFERICGVLDLDANAVRRRLRLAPERPPVSVSRALPTPTHGRGIEWARVPVSISQEAAGSALHGSTSSHAENALTARRSSTKGAPREV